MKASASSTARAFWAALFVPGLVLLGVGIAFLLSGPEMIVLTILFGGAGAFIVFESFGRMLAWEE
jgi:hypothetical protein